MTVIFIPTFESKFCYFACVYSIQLPLNHTVSETFNWFPKGINFDEVFGRLAGWTRCLVCKQGRMHLNHPL